MKPRSTSRSKLIRRKVGPCPFCQEKIEPNYLEVAQLVKFVSERGKIMGRDRSAVCAKHQRRLAIAIKRARHLALIGFTSK
jgi:small subunit ribosomal protein S18